MSNPFSPYPKQLFMPTSVQCAYNQAQGTNSTYGPVRSLPKPKEAPHSEVDVLRSARATVSNLQTIAKTFQFADSSGIDESKALAAFAVFGPLLPQVTAASTIAIPILGETRNLIDKLPFGGRPGRIKDANTAQQFFSGDISPDIPQGRELLDTVIRSKTKKVLI